MSGKDVLRETCQWLCISATTHNGIQEGRASAPPPTKPDEAGFGDPPRKLYLCLPTVRWRRLLYLTGIWKILNMKNLYMNLDFLESRVRKEDHNGSLFSHQWWNKNVCILKTRYGVYHRELSFNHLYRYPEWKDAVTPTERSWGVRGWGGNSTWLSVGGITCVRGWQMDTPPLWALPATPGIPPWASVSMSSTAETVESQWSQGRPFQCISPIDPSPPPSQRIQRKPSKWRRV